MVLFVLCPVKNSKARIAKRAGKEHTSGVDGMPTFVPRKGDWQCRELRMLDGAACGNINMAFRMKCNRCNIARPDIEVVALRLELKVKQKEIDELKAMGRSPPRASTTTQQSSTWAARAAPSAVTMTVAAPSVATAEAEKDPTSDSALMAAMLNALNAALAR